MGELYEIFASGSKLRLVASLETLNPPTLKSSMI